MSPWVDIDRAAAQMGDAYVFSRKPNPAIFAWDVWDPAEARRILSRRLTPRRRLRRRDHRQGHQHGAL